VDHFPNSIGILRSYSCIVDTWTDSDCIYQLLVTASILPRFLLGAGFPQLIHMYRRHIVSSNLRRFLQTDTEWRKRKHIRYFK